MSINNHAHIFPTDEFAADSRRFFDPPVRSPALTFVGTTTNHPATAARLLSLTPRELEVCVLHFADGRSQTQVAAWLGVTVRAIQKSIRSAVTKVPELEPLRVSQRQRHAKPRVVHLSQLSVRDRSSGLFNADEL
jgi:DNA-directed RNA polymerase specialized sigma24 family protein